MKKFIGSIIVILGATAGVILGFVLASGAISPESPRPPAVKKQKVIPGPKTKPETSLSSTFGACVLVGQTGRNPEPIRKRGLTQNETGFYSKFFGGKVDLKDACVYLYEKAPEDTSLITDVAEGDTKIISVYGEQNYSEDYTKEDNPSLFGTMAYEVTHLMQHQQGTHKNEPDSSVSSKFNTIHGHGNLNAYTEAQKRGMISDYVRFIFHPTGNTEQLGDYGSGNCPAQDLLTKTVELAFPNAETMRHEHEDRKFTDSEKALVLGIFGRQIGQIDQMVVKQRARCHGDSAGTVYGSETEFHAWTREHHEKDYTKGSLFNYGLQAHEVAHLWQNQHQDRVTAGHNETYDYPIDIKQWDFRDYFDEQQGAIIEDYVRFFLHRERDTRRLSETIENLVGLRTIVENQFPMAKKTRAYFEEHSELPDLQTVERWVGKTPLETVAKKTAAHAPQL